MKTRIALLILAIVMAGMPAIATPDPETELYERGTEALDEHEYRAAAEAFRGVARLNGENAAAALHWLAYSQNKLGQRSDALATLLDLQKRFPKSKWAGDAKALEVEIRQSAGQQIAPERVTDEDVKLMALNGLMHSDPEKALPILEKVIRGNGSPKMKEKALFVLSQSHSPRATQLLGQIARDSSNRDLQARAIKNLGILGGENSRKLLAEIYGTSNDLAIKRSILKSYMISGDRGRLLTLAKGEANEELRADAVQQLGVMGAKNELADLYATETSIPVKKKIIQAMFIGGNADKLGELARNEKVLELRLTAIKNLGLMGGKNTGATLVSMYESDSNPEVKKAVVNGLFLQGNSKALIDLARKEKDPSMKKSIVSKLSLIGNEDSTNYLMELLNE
jgi:HEAT repeat protein